MRIAKGSSSMRQQAYARRIFSGDGINKAQIALDVGYTPNVARSITSHIEDTPGFNNAMSKLALDSHNLALAAMYEFKSRGFKTFSNQEMINALNSISSAWAKFSTPMRRLGESNDTSKNRLRTVILQQIENQQNITQQAKPEEILIKRGEVIPNLDF
jgi:hypothetical protein